MANCSISHSCLAIAAPNGTTRHAARLSWIGASMRIGLALNLGGLNACGRVANAGVAQ
jgi:hypothetical protein